MLQSYRVAAATQLDRALIRGRRWPGAMRLAQLSFVNANH
jgi:hypothetical protein